MMAAAIGLLSLLALPLLWLVATVLTAFTIGDLLLNRERAARSFWGRLGMLIVGLVVLTLLGTIPVVGFLTWLAALIVGLGALWQTLRRPPPPTATHRATAFGAGHGDGCMSPPCGAPLAAVSKGHGRRSRPQQSASAPS